jgi:hypothetical protein
MIYFNAICYCIHYVLRIYSSFQHFLFLSSALSTLLTWQYFVSSSGNHFGVFDGVGGWAKKGIDPRVYSLALSQACLRAVDEKQVGLRFRVGASFGWVWFGFEISFAGLWIWILDLDLDSV